MEIKACPFYGALKIGQRELVVREEEVADCTRRAWRALALSVSRAHARVCNCEDIKKNVL